MVGYGITENACLCIFFFCNSLRGHLEESVSYAFPNCLLKGGSNFYSHQQRTEVTHFPSISFLFISHHYIIRRWNYWAILRRRLFLFGVLVLTYLYTDWIFHNLVAYRHLCMILARGQTPHALSVHLRVLLFPDQQSTNCPCIALVMMNWVTLNDRKNQRGRWRQPHKHSTNFLSTVGLLKTFNTAQKSLLVPLPVAKFQQCLNSGSFQGAAKMPWSKLSASQKETGWLVFPGSVDSTAVQNSGDNVGFRIRPICFKVSSTSK